MKHNFLRLSLRFLGLSILFAASQLEISCTAQTNEETTTDSDSLAEFVSIFDGKSLDGWEGDTTYWRVEDGNLVGEITPKTLLQKNSFIIWKGGEPADFELTGKFRITTDGNSGINYRSDWVKGMPAAPFALRGYQADIDGKNTYTGQNYEERKRTTLAYRGEKVTINNPTDTTEQAFRANLKNNAWLGRKVTDALGSADSLKALVKENDWNEFKIVAKGNQLQHYINGVLMSDVTDEDSRNSMGKGLLGVQVHVGPPMKVEYRDLMLKEDK